MNLNEAKKHFIKKHPLGGLSIAQLKEKAEKEGIFVYGDKSQILQCFLQREMMTKLFRANREVSGLQ